MQERKKEIAMEFKETTTEIKKERKKEKNKNKNKAIR